MVGRGMQRQGEVIPVIAPKQEVHNAQSSAHRWKICPLVCTLYNVFCTKLFCSAIEKNSIVLNNFPFIYLCVIHKSTALQFRVAKVNFPTSPSLMPLPLCPVEYFIGDRPPPCLVNLYDGNGGRLQYARN